jgi:NADH-quinone oxidoreductase subunit M
VKDLLNGWGPTLVTFLPMLGVVAMLAIPKAEETLQKVVALATSLAVLAVGIALLAVFDYGFDYKAHADAPFQFLVDKNWISIINARYLVGIDGISLPLIALTVLVVPLVIIYSWNHFPEPHNPKAFLLLILVLETGMVGCFVAQDLLLFFVFFELVLLPMYFLIGVFGGEKRKYASLKFFLYTAFGSALMIVSILAVYFLSPEVDGKHTFSMIALSHWGGAGLAKGTAVLVFGGFFMGFGIKVPMFPFHTWLPDAHTQAPTQGSVILASVMLKLGTYGFVRIALPILPYGAQKWAPVIGLLAVIGIIYGSLGCLAQTDMKRLIAFSSVAHMGYVMLGIATLTTWGINAAIFGMVAHGLITGMLFFIAGSVKDRFHTLEIKRLGGLLLQAPRLGWLLGFCCMASLGLPGLAGFWGEFPAILAAYNPAHGLSLPLFRTFMVVAALGTVFAAAYLLWLLQRVAFGVPTEEFEDKHIHDLHFTEYVAWIPMLIGIVVLGVAPGLIFHITDGAVSHSLAAFGR